MESNVRPIEWKDGALLLLDQTKLPRAIEYRSFTRWEDVADAIRTMIVRGAPAIGVTAAYGLALAAQSIPEQTLADEAIVRLRAAAAGLRDTRPTAVNLSWAVDRVLARIEADPQAWRTIAVAEAEAIQREDLESSMRLGEYGAQMLPDGACVFTHCNAGALATSGWGTALGVIRSAIAQGKHINVYAGETRPRLQGLRLTAWELLEDGIPVTVMTDGMAGWAMRKGKITYVLVGADRIAANGDTANKIGTYSVAVLAKVHQIPFYVAAPLSTVDFAITTGADIPIELRDTSEITHIEGAEVAPDGVNVWNPAFDVTPGEYVSAIITERGIAWPPYTESLEGLR